MILLLVACHTYTSPPFICLCSNPPVAYHTVGRSRLDPTSSRTQGPCLVFSSLLPLLPPPLPLSSFGHQDIKGLTYRTTVKTHNKLVNELL